jgi:hypothetical protein
LECRRKNGPFINPSYIPYVMSSGAAEMGSKAAN